MTEKDEGKIAKQLETSAPKAVVNSLNSFFIYPRHSTEEDNNLGMPIKQRQNSSQPNPALSSNSEETGNLVRQKVFRL